jgi:hypothetical protein
MAADFRPIRVFHQELALIVRVVVSHNHILDFMAIQFSKNSDSWAFRMLSRPFSQKITGASPILLPGRHRALEVA